MASSAQRKHFMIATLAAFVFAVCCHAQPADKGGEPKDKAGKMKKEAQAEGKEMKGGMMGQGGMAPT